MLRILNYIAWYCEPWMRLTLREEGKLNISSISMVWSFICTFSIHEEFDVLITTVVRFCWDWIRCSITRTIRRSDEDWGKILLLLSHEASSRFYNLTFRPQLFHDLIVFSWVYIFWYCQLFTFALTHRALRVFLSLLVISAS